MLYDLIVYTRTTAVEPVDTLIPSNGVICYMGGPAANKIPNHDGDNATLKGLSD